jgi:drug/metabolite transporter (DMT)-like permease
LGGLVILFSDDLARPSASTELLGAAAIIVGTLSYCLGSVLAKPLMENLEPLQVTAAHAAVGAIGFPIVTVFLEPISTQTFLDLAAPAPLTGLLFLVIFGTFIAYTIYMRLVRDWGAPRAGLYAFTSPVIALVLGAIVFGEPLGIREGAGAALMLSAAAFALRDRRN